jgi:hypothetical protein
VAPNFAVASLRSLQPLGKAALEIGARNLTGGLLGTKGITSLAGVAAVPTAIGSVVGPVADMLFPAPANRGEIDLSGSRDRYGPATPQDPRPIHSRSATPFISGFGPNYKQKELAAGQAAEDFRRGAGFPGQQMPIVTGADQNGNVDRSQRDMYKQYAKNPQGQFERYFQGPQMDQYFGAASRGAGAPQSADAMQALAGKTTAPTGTPLATFYRAESATGRANMPGIISEMGYSGDMAKWAAANPMLAQREFAKRFGGSAPTGEGMPQALPGVDTSKMMPTSAMGGFKVPGADQAPTFNPQLPGVDTSKMMPTQAMEQHSFGQPANSLAAPPQQQGNAISGAFAPAQAEAAKKTAGATGMPNLPTTPEARTPGTDFLDKAMSSPWGNALTKTLGSMFINKIRGL